MTTITVDMSKVMRQIRYEAEQACQMILDAPHDQRDLIAARLRNGTLIEREVALKYEYFRREAEQEIGIDSPRIVAGATAGYDRATVYLDDELVHGCMEADSAAGYVIVQPGGITDGGWTPVEGDPFKKFGTVRIEFRDSAQTLNTPDPVPQAERR